MSYSEHDLVCKSCEEEISFDDETVCNECKGVYCQYCVDDVFSIAFRRKDCDEDNIMCNMCIDMSRITKAITLDTFLSRE